MGAKTDVIVKLVFVFFISLLSFSIGTFVGKKYSDNQHQLAALEPNKNKAVVVKDEHKDEHAEEKGDIAREVASEEEPAMSDDEIAKLAEEFVKEDDAHSAHAPTEAPAATKVVATEKKEVAKTPENPSLPTPKELATVQQKVQNADKTRVPTSLPQDVGTFKPGKFTVQVASSADEKEAQTLTADLKTKGYASFYIPAEIKGKTWYRVSVGQFNTMKEAQGYRAELIEKGHVKTAIIQKIAQ
ncbi:MAG: SPOR domain-containing protein [Bdellovibrionia bacterium]